MSGPPEPRRRRHLMDPNAPRPVRDAVTQAAEDKSLSSVQRWVTSALIVTTLFILMTGLIIAAASLNDPRPGARVGLCLIAGAFAVIAIALARLIHERTLLSAWLLVGLVPAAIGIVMTR